MDHFVVTLRLEVKNSIAPSAVMSMSPYFDFVPYSPPNEKGSRGTGIPAETCFVSTVPMFVPSLS